MLPTLYGPWLHWQQYQVQTATTLGGMVEVMFGGGWTGDREQKSLLEVLWHKVPSEDVEDVGDESQ